MKFTIGMPKNQHSYRKMNDIQKIVTINWFVCLKHNTRIRFHIGRLTLTIGKSINKNALASCNDTMISCAVSTHEISSRINVLLPKHYTTENNRVTTVIYS